MNKKREVRINKESGGGVKDSDKERRKMWFVNQQ